MLTLAFSANSEDLTCTIHTHPSLTEAMHETVLTVEARPASLAGILPGIILMAATKMYWVS